MDSDYEMCNIRAIKELRLLWRAGRHPNILTLYGGLIISKKEIWIVTEFINEGDLHGVQKWMLGKKIHYINNVVVVLHNNAKC